MPVYIRFSNLIIDKEVIQKKYKGGIKQFRADYQSDNELFQEDNELFSLAAMDSKDFTIQEMMRNGFEYDWQTQTSNDYVIVERYGGAVWHVDWLEVGKIYAYHRKASLSNVMEAFQMEKITVGEIERIFAGGGKPFKTIK